MNLNPLISMIERSLNNSMQTDSASNGYYQTTLSDLSNQLGVSTLNIRRQLKSLVRENEYRYYYKHSSRGEYITITSSKILDDLPLIKLTKTDKALLDSLFNTEPTEFLRKKHEVESYKAEVGLMSKWQKQDNLVFTHAIKENSILNYQETFAKLSENSKDAYQVYLVSRIYDTYAIAFDKQYLKWYTEDLAYNKNKRQDEQRLLRGRGRTYHKNNFQSLKPPFIGTNAYELSQLLIKTAKSFRVSVPAYVYTILANYAWKNANGYGSPFVPSLAQITDEKRQGIFSRIMKRREYAWEKTNKDFPYSDLNDTAVMYAISVYRLNLMNNKSDDYYMINYPTNNQATLSYQSYYLDCIRQINDLHLNPSDTFWAKTYLREQVSLALGILSNASYRLSPILNYLINKHNGIKSVYKQWVKEDNGNQVEASQDLFTYLGQDVQTAPMQSREDYENKVIHNLDNFMAVCQLSKNNPIADLYLLELTRQGHTAKLNLPGLIKELTPIMFLTDKGLIDRDKIKEIY